MNYSLLTAISPLDGRYKKQVAALSDFFSEQAFIRYRLRVEVEYFIALCEIPLPELKSFDKNNFKALRDIYLKFKLEDAAAVKEIEATINHDVKAIEYFLKTKFEDLGLGASKEFIHFGLTSQDINNTAIPLFTKEANEQVYIPLLDSVLFKLKGMADEWKDIPMLARTHGQPASPTRLGKEINVFVERLEAQKKSLLAVPVSAKFGGATGNFNAHHIAYPQVDWVGFSNVFVNKRLGLHRTQTTTQIEHYDNTAAWCDAMKRINTILLDLNRDMWSYISMEYFRQKINTDEIGSSAMPHKVNPIDFENSEGNIGIANALFEHLSAKLPVSRLQRDLSDSTVLRNIGVPVAHSVIALQSLLKGLNKILLNRDAINKDLEHNWVVVAEAIQTILRKEGIPNPYEQLKQLTRTNSHIGKVEMEKFIDGLDVSEELKLRLKAITPFNYTGV